MQIKFPLKNKLLKLLSPFDPKCHGNSIAALMMKKLKSYFLNIIKDDEISGASNIEVNNYHLTNNLQSVSQSDDAEKSLGMWWTETFVSGLFVLANQSKTLSTYATFLKS